MLRVFLIDDEPLARQLIREFLADTATVTIIGECGDGETAAREINRHKPDLIFLDVQMPILSGFETLKRLTHIPLIIFTTAFDTFALQAFEVSAVDYLLKPFDRPRFEKALERALARHHAASQTAEQHAETDSQKLNALLTHLERSSAGTSSKDAYTDTLMVRKGQYIVPVKTELIERIDAADDYAMLHVGKDTYLTTAGISTLETRLNPKQFMRVHRSTIINLRFIQRLELDGNGGMNATLQSGAVVKVSRNYAADLKKMVV
jgi:two-component system, LytTR family, response regulator